VIFNKVLGSPAGGDVMRGKDNVLRPSEMVLETGPPERKFAYRNWTQLQTRATSPTFAAELIKGSTSTFEHALTSCTASALRRLDARTAATHGRGL
jgi:hypothetical protein